MCVPITEECSLSLKEFLMWRYPIYMYIVLEGKHIDSEIN